MITVAQNNPGKRIMVFCAQVSGRESVKSMAASVGRSGVKHKIIQLYREVYNIRAEMASDLESYPEGVIIFTTNIAECGANYDIDIVLDSCMT